jgi:hypothetical protein
MMLNLDLYYIIRKGGRAGGLMLTRSGCSEVRWKRIGYVSGKTIPRSSEDEDELNIVRKFVLIHGGSA